MTQERERKRVCDGWKEVGEGSEGRMHVWKEDILLVGATQQRGTRALRDGRGAETKGEERQERDKQRVGHSKGEENESTDTKDDEKARSA